MLNPFKVVQITDEQSKQALYHLRYKVYVEEFGFENAQNYENNLEFDSYDENSLQFAAYNQSDILVGTARLILSTAANLPFEKITNLSVPVNSAEISRVVVHPSYRGAFTENLQPGVALHLVKILWRKSKDIQIKDWCTLIEWRLYNFLQSIGIMFNQVTPFIEHRGVRVPCMITLDQFEKRLKTHNPSLYDFICS